MFRYELARMIKFTQRLLRLNESDLRQSAHQNITQFERVEAYVFPNHISGTIPLYRHYEPNARDHFYTTNFNELGTGKLGWYLEGVQCYVLP